MISNGAIGACSRASDMEPLVLQRLLDGAQTIRPLGMAERGQVIEAGGMAEKRGWTLGCSNVAWRGRQPCQAFAFRLTPLGGGMLSGTKKSTCSGWLGSTRYWSKSVTPSPARNVSSIRKLPVKLFGLWKMR